MEAELIIYMASAVLSGVFEYLPGLSAKYNELADNVQKLIMLGLLAVVVLAAFVASCLGLDGRYTCDQGGALLAVRDFIAAVVVNQGVFMILPKAKG